ncbi:hypothetical protein CH92_06670 [Stutzerimonas stutzeri]|uniref:Uncharacterized protein n=1 Tax=Stutzerimonas stutzeri TaxID=316 RepID=W8RRX6_STUST|nr:hypothetical protein CH92_06670 [Stutzerimonas stutzeri]
MQFDLKKPDQQRSEHCDLASQALLCFHSPALSAPQCHARRSGFPLGTPGVKAPPVEQIDHLIRIFPTNLGLLCTACASDHQRRLISLIGATQ